MHPWIGLLVLIVVCVTTCGDRGLVRKARETAMDAVRFDLRAGPFGP
jgi:hypothetical protein